MLYVNSILNYKYYVVIAFWIKLLIAYCSRIHRRTYSNKYINNHLKIKLCINCYIINAKQGEFVYRNVYTNKFTIE